jgi:TonB family protein
MIRRQLFILALCYCCFAAAQRSSTDPAFEGHVIGGKAEVTQVLQTQLTLPKTLLTPDFGRQITCFFNLDSLNRATDLKFEGQLNNALRNELTRIFLFHRFQRTLNLPDEKRPYFMQFDISTAKYKKHIKQTYRFRIRKNLQADSSYVVFTRADRPPEYFKNGEEGLNDYILSEIEYPKIAKERSIQGTVILEFVVETNGYITGINVRQPVNGGCTEEAIRIMKATRWQPAELGGKFVRYKMSYPITFNLAVNNANFKAVESLGN